MTNIKNTTQIMTPEEITALDTLDTFTEQARQIIFTKTDKNTAIASWKNILNNLIPIQQAMLTHAIERAYPNITNLQKEASTGDPETMETVPPGTKRTPCPHCGATWKPFGHQVTRKGTPAEWARTHTPPCVTPNTTQHTQQTTK